MSNPNPDMPADIAAAIDALQARAWTSGRHDDDGSRADAARATLDAAILARLARAERLEGFIDFVLKWRDRGAPHGDPVTAWNVVSHHPVVSERARTRAALSPAAEEA